MTITITFMDGSTPITTTTEQDMSTILTAVENNTFVNTDKLILRTNNIQAITETT